MRTQKLLVALSLLNSLGSWGNLQAGGRDAFPFLLSAPTPRAAALGESFVGVAEGPETIFFNPAGLAFQNRKHFYAQSLLPPFIEDTKYNNLVYSQPASYGGWGIQTGILHVGGFTRTIADPATADGFREAGDFSTYDLRVGGALAGRIGENWGAGAGIYFLRESLSDASANGVGLDFGLLYRDDLYPLQAGLAVQNLGPKVKFQEESFNLPTLFRGGVSLYKPKEVSLDFIPEKSLISAEFFRPFRGESSVRGGVEIPLIESLLFRAGYNYSFKKQELGSKLIPRGVTIGIGIKMNVWQLDYAVVSLGELGLTHRVALDLRWGAP